MKRTIMIVAVLVFLSGGNVRTEPCCLDRDREKLVFVGFPDSAEFLIAEVLERVGEAYQRKNPDVHVKVIRGTSYIAARDMVLDERADAMMISDMMNRPRAWLTQNEYKSKSYEFKLNMFLPVVTRTIRSKDRVIEKMRLGVVTNERTERLMDFMNFLSSNQAKDLISDIKYLEITPPSSSPEKIKQVRFRADDKTLDQPILSF